MALFHGSHFSELRLEDWEASVSEAAGQSDVTVVLSQDITFLHVH